MEKKKLVYVWSLRNAAADQAGQMIEYKNGKRYMKSVLEYLAEQLKLDELEADVIMLDGLLVILNLLADEKNPYYKKIANIHPGITSLDSPYVRRGATATLDALYGAKGQKVINWNTLATEPTSIIAKTGASFHYVDKGIDSGPVIADALNTNISPEDTILELRWNNFNSSLFPTMCEGLKHLSQ